MERVYQGIAIGVTLLVLGYFVTTSVRMERFMIGERCTAMRCNALESKLDSLPPRWLQDRIVNHTLEQQRLQRQIDRLENRHSGIRSEVLPPYGKE